VELFYLIAEETNRYAQSKGAINFAVTPAEIAAFIGISIAMGIVNMLRAHYYWSTNPVLNHPWFRTVMPRDRFYLIQKYLHFNDNSLAVNKDHPHHDKLFKIRPVLDIVNETFRLHYSPGMNVSVDEQMIGTKAKLSFIQYLPKKPKKWEVKVWVLADSANGYVPAFEIYTGAADGVEHGLAYGVVMRLMEDYLDCGCCLYVDNFYSSPQLFEDLLSRETMACGTVRQNRRGLPQQKSSLKRGETVFMKKGDLTFVHWMDKRDVWCLSTFHANQMVPFTTRRQGVEAITRPKMITDYNKYMGGVDRMDQMLVYYSIGRKTIKWYKRIFWRIIDLTLVNAYVLYSICHPDRMMKHKAFRLQLADKLVEEYIDANAHPDRDVVISGHRVSLGQSRLKGKHFATSSSVRGRCAVCGNKKNPDGTRRDRKTCNYCPKCKKHLCRKDCFEKYHTRYRL